MENILLPWAVLGMIILIIKSMSCGISCPCRDCGAPPMLATAHDPVAVPRSLSPVSATPQQGWSPVPLRAAKPGPNLVQASACSYPQEGA